MVPASRVAWLPPLPYFFTVGLPANLLGTSSQAHQLAMSLMYIKIVNNPSGVTVESGDQRAKKAVSDSLGLQLKITTSAKFPWEVGVAVDKYKYKYEKKRGEGTNTVKNSGMQFSQQTMQL